MVLLLHSFLDRHRLVSVIEKSLLSNIINSDVQASVSASFTWNCQNVLALSVNVWVSISVVFMIRWETQEKDITRKKGEPFCQRQLKTCISAASLSILNSLHILL